MYHYTIIQTEQVQLYYYHFQASGRVKNHTFEKPFMPNMILLKPNIDVDHFNGLRIIDKD